MDFALQFVTFKNVFKERLVTSASRILNQLFLMHTEVESCPTILSSAPVVSIPLEMLTLP